MTTFSTNIFNESDLESCSMRAFIKIMIDPSKGKNEIDHDIMLICYFISV